VGLESDVPPAEKPVSAANSAFVAKELQFADSIDAVAHVLVRHSSFQ
jgi:hypothetical protein